MPTWIVVYVNSDGIIRRFTTMVRSPHEALAEAVRAGITAESVRGIELVDGCTDC